MHQSDGRRRAAPKCWHCATLHRRRWPCSSRAYAQCAAAAAASASVVVWSWPGAPASGYRRQSVVVVVSQLCTAIVSYYEPAASQPASFVACGGSGGTFVPNVCAERCSLCALRLVRALARIVLCSVVGNFERAVVTARRLPQQREKFNPASQPASQRAAAKLAAGGGGRQLAQETAPSLAAALKPGSAQSQLRCTSATFSRIRLLLAVQQRRRCAPSTATECKLHLQHNTQCRPAGVFTTTTQQRRAGRHWRRRRRVQGRSRCGHTAHNHNNRASVRACALLRKKRWGGKAGSEQRRRGGGGRTNRARFRTL